MENNFKDLARGNNQCLNGSACAEASMVAPRVLELCEDYYSKVGGGGTGMPPFPGDLPCQRRATCLKHKVASGGGMAVNARSLDHPAMHLPAGPCPGPLWQPNQAPLNLLLIPLSPAPHSPPCTAFSCSNGPQAAAGATMQIVLCFPDFMGQGSMPMLRMLCRCTAQWRWRAFSAPSSRTSCAA